MARTDLKILSTNAGTGQKMTTTISHVNPAANSTLLRQLGTKLNSMTTNNYSETDRVQTINVDTETVPPLTGTLEFNTPVTATLTGSRVQIPMNSLQINGVTYDTLANVNTIGILGRGYNVTTSQDMLLTSDNTSIALYHPNVATAQPGKYTFHIVTYDVTNKYTPAYKYITLDVA